MINQLISIGVVILIAITLYPTIIDQINNLELNNSSISAPSGTLLQFIPSFFALIICGIILALIYSALRSSGLIGTEPEDEDEELFKKPNEKQTYKEYVEERLDVERMLK